MAAAFEVAYGCRLRGGSCRHVAAPDCSDCRDAEEVVVEGGGWRPDSVDVRGVAAPPPFVSRATCTAAPGCGSCSAVKIGARGEAEASTAAASGVAAAAMATDWG